MSDTSRRLREVLRETACLPIRSGRIGARASLLFRLSLFTRLEKIIVGFCERRTAGFCRECRELMARYVPEDPDRGLRVTRGTWPGCCHPGAASLRHFSFGGATRSLSPCFWAAWEGKKVSRRRSGALSDADEEGYVVADPESGREYRGSHCDYFGADGCLLQRGRGLLCLAFFCPPLQKELVARGVSEALLVDEDDPLGVFAATMTICWGTHQAGVVALRAVSARLARIEVALSANTAAGSRGSTF